MPKFTPNVARARAEVQALVDEYHLPGAGLGIVVGEELVHAEGFGWADIAAKKPYTVDVRHRLGSVTKTFVGLCVMALVDEGRLALDAKVAELLPDIPFHRHGEALTVWHLLTHTGGIGEAPAESDLHKPFDKLFYETDPSVPLAELYTEGVLIEAAPGTKWAYANHGFALLGEIVSRTEGAPLAEVMERRVFGPLGMEATDLDDVPHPQLARGYSQAETPEALSMLKLLGVQLDSEEKVDGYNMPGKFVRVWGNGGAGAAQSTVPDMAKYASALLRGSRGVVRPETLARMTADQWRPDMRLPGWGLGFAVRGEGGLRRFGHGGSVFGGWNSSLLVWPDLDASLIFHVSLMSDYFDGVFTPRLVNAFLDRHDELLPEIALNERVLATAPGVFELTMPGPLTNFRPQFNAGRVKIENERGELVMYSRRGPWKGGVRLRQARPGDPDFFAIDMPGYPRNYLSLLLDDTGAVMGIRFPQIVDYVRNPELEAWS